jgi:S1-C subfamily serine protease
MFSAMNGPKRLWSGDWSEESAAARARMAHRRAQRSALADDPTEPLAAPTPPPPPRGPSAARQLLDAVALRSRAAATRARGLVAVRRQLVPRGLRGRLIVIALLAGLGGAAVTIGVEAANGSATPAAQRGAQPYLGVELGDAPGESGALIALVYPGTPAAGAGLEPGDLITSIDGSPISDEDAAANAIDALRPGQRIRLGIDRLGRQLVITATLGTRPANAP